MVRNLLRSFQGKNYCFNPRSIGISECFSLVVGTLNLIRYICFVSNFFKEYFSRRSCRDYINIKVCLACPL